MRTKFWRIGTIESLLLDRSFQAITLLASEDFVFPDAEGSGAWTRVNNCTRENDQNVVTKQSSHQNDEYLGNQEPITGPPRKTISEEELDDPRRLDPLIAEVRRRRIFKKKPIHPRP